MLAVQPPRPERATWRETATLTVVAAILLTVLTRKGLSTYFFSEAFVYLGTYRQAGDDFFRALFVPHGSIFFRPSVWAVNLAWNLFAPPDALLYHLRNLTFIILDALLLHRLLLRLVATRSARAVGVIFFAVSKVHLTTIGYAALFSTILMLTATLGMLVAFCRHLERGRRFDFIATLLCAVFVVGGKEYGMAALVLLPLLAWARGTDPGEAVRPLVVPLLLVIALYAGTRLWVSPPRPSGVYAPRIDARLMLKKAADVPATLANMSLDEESGINGRGGVTSLLWSSARQGRIAERLILLGLVVGLLALIRVTRPPLPLVVFCVAWGTLMFAPTLLTANHQLYYLNDVVAAFPVLLAGLAARASQRMRVALVAIVFLIALNAEVSQGHMSYIWYTMAEKTRPLERIAAVHRNAPVETVIFVTSDVPYWEFAVLADGTGAFVQQLFRRPDLGVRVIDRQAVRSSGALVIDVDQGMKVIAAQD